MEAPNLVLEAGAGSELSLDAAEKLNDDITSRRSAADAGKAKHFADSRSC